MNKIAVYGSLKEGGFNHQAYGLDKPLGTVKIPNYNLYSLGHYPAAVKGNGEIVAEVYEVDDITYWEICYMEVGTGYIPVTVDTEFGQCFMFEFVYSKPKKKSLIINGNWKP